MHFAKRTNWETSPNKFARRLAALREKNIGILDLTESNPTRCHFEFYRPELLKPLLNPDNLIYKPDPRGILKAREAVAQYYARKNIAVEPEQIFLASSTSEAYGFILRLLAEPGDSVLAPAPGYPLLDFLAQIHDVRILNYPPVYDNGWRIPFDKLKAARDDGTRAVIVVHPNNPTGNFVREDEAKALNEICQTGKMAIVADEVFSDFVFSSEGCVKSFASNPNVLTFTLGGISKALGLPQMKLSWMVLSGPEVFRSEAAKRLEIIADTYLSPGTPVQRALAEWLRLAPEIQREIQQRISSNRDYLAQKISGLKNLRAPVTDGGWYALLKVETSSRETDEEIALELLETDHVALHPGYLYNFTRGNFLVLSLLPPAKIFREGVDRIAQRLGVKEKQPA